MRNALTTMTRYLHTIERINYLLFLAVMFLLPFPQVFLRYTTVAWLVTWLMEGRWLHHKHLTHTHERTAPYRNPLCIPCLLFTIWFIGEAFSAFWAPDTTLVLEQLERHMAIPLMLPIIYWGVNKQYDARQISKALIYGCLAAIPIYMFTLFWVYNHACVEQAEQHLATSFMPLRFFANGISTLKHRLFLCSIETFGIVAVFYRRSNLCATFGKTKGWLITAAQIACMLLFILATGSRASIFTIIALVSVATITYTHKRYGTSWSTIGALTIIITITITISICIIHIHPRMQTFTLHHLNLEELDPQRNPRLNIWAMAFDQPADYLAHGLGAGQSRAYLLQRYQAHGYTSYANKTYDSHNQYLTELLELGIPGLLLFIAAWLSIIICTHGAQRRYAAYMVTLFALNMLTDNMFGRYDGIALWCTWLMLIALQTNTKTEEKTTRYT